MMKKEYAGLHAALVTPYTETGEVNYRELKKLVRRLIAEGIDGFYVGGSTAETFLLTESERKGILEAVLEENNGEKLVVSHVGAISTRQAVDFAQHAEAAGADAVSAISPFYYKFTQREIEDYYLEIMAGSGLPMFVYNFPNLSGFALTKPFLERLKSSSRLAGIKFTSSDMFQLERIKARNPGLTVWNGFDEMLLSGLAAGADGGVGSTYNCLLPLGARGIRPVPRGRPRAGARLPAQGERGDRSHLPPRGVRIGQKAARIFRHRIPRMQAPFSPLSPEGEAELRRVYETHLAR